MIGFFSSDDEDEEESYDGERVDGQEDGGLNVVFDEEIRKILNQEPAWINAIPKPFVAEDGTRMYFFSPEKEVELVVRDE